MKITLKIIALSTLGFTTLCYANEPQETSLLTDMFSKSHFDKDFSASVGLRLWENKWNLPYWLFNSENPRQFLTFQNDAVFTNSSNSSSVDIPTVGLRYKNFFLSGSYFKKTEYSFREQHISESNFSNGNLMAFPYKFSQTAERKEWDTNIGYFLTKNIVLTAGYKTINRFYTRIGRLDNSSGIYNLLASAEQINSIQATTLVDSKGEGPIIGISSSVPINNTSFSLYGNFSYGRLKTKQAAYPPFGRDINGEYSSNSGIKYTNYNNNYYSGEFGISYAIPFKDNYFSAISMSLGYRFQRYEFKNVLSPDIAQTAVDTTDGFVAGINILF